MPPRATPVVISKLLHVLGVSNANPVVSVSLPDAIDVDCEIRNYKVLGSYNWLDSLAPTILIPGQPRVWQEPKLPLQLSPDHGFIFVDQNAWRCHQSPLEPLFRSISVTQKLIGNTTFSLSEQRIDVVTDRNNLRKLCAMIRSIRVNEILAPSKNREFRIDAQLAPNGRTILLTRYSPEPLQPINPGDTGYGTNFERATTSNYTPIGVPNHNHSDSKEFTPTSYHRVANYSLADLNLIVRYEVDAVQQAPRPSIPEQLFHAHEIRTQPQSTLRHVISGASIPQDHIMELKTGKLKWAQIYPQLYFSQTPILKFGVHRNGSFSKVEDHIVHQIDDGPAAEFRQDLIDNLRFLVPLLKQMKHACQQHGRSGEPLTFFWSGAGPLQLYKITQPERSYSLPKDILEIL